MSHSRLMQGSVLLEGLLAVLIFSVGVLALIGMQANAINTISEVKYRTDAAFLADQLIGEMWVASPANLPGFAYSGSGAGGSAIQPWLAQVGTTLPGAIANPPIVTVVPSTLFTPTGGAAVTQYTITVTIRYLPPKTTAVRRHVATAVVS